MVKLNLSKCTTNAEVCKLISDRVNEVPFKDLITSVEKKFVFQADNAKAIYTGLSMNMNVFLSGEGGFGKSELIKHVLDFYKIPYHTLVGYNDMPVDAMLGIPNMDKLLKKSEYEIAFEKSIFGKPGVLIGEEFTHISSESAAALKDILTERGFRNKEGKVESLIGIVIVAANKSAAEVSNDHSKAALFEERFPIHREVTWEKFTVGSYFMLLNKVFPKADAQMLYLMASLFEDNAMNRNNIITPRTAINITSVYLNKGIEFIKDFKVDLSYFISIKNKAAIEFKHKVNVNIIDELKLNLESIKQADTALMAGLLLLHKIKDQKISIDLIKQVKEFKKYLVLFIASKGIPDGLSPMINELSKLNDN